MYPKGGRGMRFVGRNPVVQVVLIAVAVLVVAYPVIAGVGYSVRCSDCDLDAKLFYGGGKADVTVAVGYCCKCEEFVRISYDSTNVTDDERTKLTTPLGEVFSVETGEKLTIYACPKCGGPFAAIDPKAFGDPKHPKALYCPKCGKQTLTGEASIRWD
jgi:predicted RNA-binding Zn-ribbon protein involved in translation (DUF1610 family)